MASSRSNKSTDSTLTITRVYRPDLQRQLDALLKLLSYETSTEVEAEAPVEPLDVGDGLPASSPDNDD